MLRRRLFDFGKVDAEVAQARGANAEALATYCQAVLGAAEDVEDPLAGLSQTQVHVVELQDEAQSLIKARDLAGGLSGRLDRAHRRLNADSQLLTVQDQIDANRADEARAAVIGFRALGGGWDPRDLPTIRDVIAPLSASLTRASTHLPRGRGAGTCRSGDSDGMMLYGQEYPNFCGCDKQCHG